MERCFFFLLFVFCPLHFVQGLRSLQQWVLQKLSMKTFDQKFKFLIKKYFKNVNLLTTKNTTLKLPDPKKNLFSKSNLMQ